MKKNKKHEKKDQSFHVNPENPADKGVDHNITRGKEKDYEDSYIRKQESEGGRGVDNEDDTSALESDEANTEDIEK